MRPFAAIAAAALLAAALPGAAHADGAAPHAWHHYARHARVMHRRRARWVAPAPQVPIYFAWNIPPTTSPGYDRALVLLLRSPAVSGIYTDDPGFAVTPVVAGDEPYQYDACCAVLQYDSATGRYIQLSQADAAHAARPPGNVPIPLPTPLR